MARSFVSAAFRVVREVDRATKRYEREQERLRRQAIREEQADLRQLKATQKAEKQQYLEERAAEVADMNAEIETAVATLKNLLGNALVDSPSINWSSVAGFPQGHGVAAPISAIPDVPTVESLVAKAPGFISRLIPGRSTRYRREVEAAEEKVSRLRTEHYEAVRQQAAALARQQERMSEQDAEVRLLRQRYKDADPEAVAQVFRTVLESSQLPDAFPCAAHTAFSSESRHLIVDYQLPTLLEAVPENEQYRYTRSNDTITAVRRSAKSTNELYADAIAQIVLRSLHEIFSADEAQVLSAVTINGMVDTTDPSTGRRVRPYLLSVRTTVGQFRQLDLEHVNPVLCLKGLEAAVSRSPAELVPVRPIVDISTVDPRFVKEADVLGTLDQRSNLMELSPSEFESLITNLFQRMGLDTRQTQASRDGGVDCVAFDLRPIFGGKVVVQAKRYKNTVGVGSVRDLYGTMLNEGASKGILVTTSGYGTAAFEFAKGKPIELIDGANLLFLLSEHADVQAKIEVPDDWEEPQNSD